ncbi:hypothetical protein JXM83_00980 [Candidatus Woesearchaeota archaeon]|nr:hypothetical protein [Candidatus Woesearchaeota archaeon]
MRKLFATLSIFFVLLFGLSYFAYSLTFSYEISVGGSTAITPRGGMAAKLGSSATYDAWGNLKIGSSTDPYTCSQGTLLTKWTFDDDRYGNPAAVTCYASNGDICTSSGSYVIDHDTYSDSCTACGYYYNAGVGDCTPPSCTTQCCGDDAGELYRTQHGHGNNNVQYGNIAWTNVVVDACCNAGDNIDYTGACVQSYTAAGSGVAVLTGYSGADKYSASYYNSDPSHGWLECDYYANNYCRNICGGATFVLAGEAVGEYSPGAVNDNGGRTDMGSNTFGYAECCGDDDGEIYIDDSAITGAGFACCNNANDCVDDTAGGLVCVSSDNGALSYSDDLQYYCTSGNWLSVDDSQSLCEVSFVWFADKDGFTGGDENCCGDDTTNDDFGRITFASDSCDICLDGSPSSDSPCYASGTLEQGLTDSADLCYYDSVNLDASRLNDCLSSGCLVDTNQFSSVIAGVQTDCVYGDPALGDQYCLTDDNVVAVDTTYDYCHYGITCAVAGISGWYADVENCRDTNYDNSDVALNYQCWYEQFGTLQNDRSDDCEDTGCINVDVCTVGLGQICALEPSATTTGCIVTQSECNLDCMALGYNNGTVVDIHTCNCGISNFTTFASSTALVPLESNDTVQFNATAINMDKRLDYEGQPVDLDICQNAACGSLLYTSYTEPDLPGNQEKVSFSENIPFCDYRGAGVFFFTRITDSVGKSHTQISSDVYNVRKTDSCLCSDDIECFSNYQLNGGCDSDDGWCYTCVNDTDSIDTKCEFDDSCGSALTCDELDPFSCVPYVGWCNGTNGCGSNPNVICSDEIVVDSGTSTDICLIKRNESTAHCGCIDNVDEGKSCDNDFDGSTMGGTEGICIDSECVESLAVQINVGNLSGLGAEYDPICDFNDGKPCVNDVSFEYVRDGTCAATDIGATSFECDVTGHVAFNGVNYFNGCSLVADGTGCDSNASRTGTNDLYNRNGICTGGVCCEAGYVDVNNNTLYDDPGACGSFGELVEGFLCDQDLDFTWDGYVVYNQSADSWICSNNTPFAFYDSKPGDFLDREVTFGCDMIVGPLGSQGKICDDTFVPINSFMQDGICVLDQTLLYPFCDIVGGSVYDSSLMIFTGDCNLTRNSAGGFVCDPTVSPGDFYSSGFCAMNSSASTTVCFEGMVSSDCDSGVCNITGNQSYVGCIAGLACGDTVTGFNWVQEGTCLNTSFDLSSCDKSTEIVFNGTHFFDDCTNHTYLDCDSNVQIGNYEKDGQCYVGVCDNSDPVLVGPLITNVSLNSWFSDFVYMECLGASDIGSGIDNNSYLFQYASTHTPIESDWNNISSCINSTYNCTWNVSSLIYLENLTLRCRVSDLARQESNWIRDNFSGIDIVPPIVHLWQPENNKNLSQPLIDFIFNVTDNNNNGSLDNCLLRIYENMTHVLYKTQSFDHPLEGVNNVEFTGLTKGQYYWNVICYDLAMNSNVSENFSIDVQESEYFAIEPMSETGFINASKKYTTSRVVHLMISLGNSTDRCSFKNDVGEWSAWEDCDIFKTWVLSEGIGVKTVFANVSHKPPFEDVYLIYMDSIYYDPSGQFLDTSAPVINEFRDYLNYTDSLDGFDLYVDAEDAEDIFYDSEISYKISVLRSNGLINETIISDKSFIPDPLTKKYFVDLQYFGQNMSDGYIYYARLDVTNRANLSAVAYTDGIIVDLMPPVNLTISSLSHAEGVWTPNSTVTLSLNDTDSFLDGYSIVLDHSLSTIPDDFVDLRTSDIVYSNLPDGYYYFHGKSRDLVGNWGNPVSYGFGLDVTPPEKPVVINSPQRATGNYVEFCWTPAYDSDSGLSAYHVSIYDWNSNLVASSDTLADCYLFESAVKNIVYYAKVIAENGAGLFSEDGLVGSSLEITHVKPKDSSTGVALVDTSDPILVVQTNKNAVCNYRIEGLSGSSFSFLFTDYLHHETRIEDLEKDVIYDIEISCIDSLGNVKVAETSIRYKDTTPDELLVENADSQAFTGQMYDFDVIVTSDGIGVGELSKDDFTLELLDENETNVLDSFVIDDLGAGQYKFYFMISQNSGDYILSLKLDTLEYTSDVEVADLNFEVVFDFVEEKGDLVLSNLVAKNVGLFTVGLASEGNNLDLDTNDDLIRLNTKYENGVVYLFVVQNDDKLKKVSSLLKDSSLLDFISPSFGDFLSEEITLNAELFYTDVEFRKDFSLTNGRYILYLSNKGLDDSNKTEVSLNSK